MPVSRANGLDIYYEIAGSGPPLVLVHALPFDHNLWLYQVERFSARFRTLAMDLRGWGHSAKPRAPFGLADMGNDILKLMAEQHMRDGAVVLGCSIGSKIALMLACDHRRYSRRPFWSAATAAHNRSSIIASRPIGRTRRPARWPTITSVT